MHFYLEAWNTIRVSNDLDPDQDRHCVSSDLVPYCLQSYQQITKVPRLPSARKELIWAFHSIHDNGLQLSLLLMYLGGINCNQYKQSDQGS